MKRKYLQRDKRGVGGFMEDLPAFLFILVGVMVFLISLTSSLLTYYEYKTMTDIGEQVQKLGDDIRGWDFLAPETKGMFVESQIYALTDEVLIDHYGNYTFNFLLKI